MSHYDLSRFLFKFNHDPSVRAAYAADPITAIEGYELTPEEQDALARHDFGALYRMDIHPLLLVYMSNNLAVPPDQYVAAINDAPAPVPASGG